MDTKSNQTQYITSFFESFITLANKHDNHEITKDTASLKFSYARVDRIKDQIKCIKQERLIKINFKKPKKCFTYIFNIQNLYFLFKKKKKN